MSNPVPKQKKSNENITLHVQEGIGVCFPNPPQTPPIHRSSFALDVMRHGFMTHPGRRLRLLLYVKIRPCKLFSRLPEIFEGKRDAASPGRQADSSCRR
jgi:hypothetical protein